MLLIDSLITLQFSVTDKLNHAYAFRSSWFLCPGQGKKKKGGGVGSKGVVRAVRPESIAGGGCFEVLWNLESPVGLSQERNMYAFQ